MKKIFTLLLAVLTLGANAAVVDLGELQLDTDYALSGNFSDYIGSFTAPASGTLVATGTNSTILEPYVAKLDDMEAEGNHINVNWDNYYGTKQYHFEVTEGTTYYFYINFCMNSSTFRLAMDAGEGIQIAKCTPEEGSTFSVSGGGLVSVQFNRAVSLNHEAKILAAGKEASVAVNGQTNIYSLEIKEIIMGWLTDGTLAGGDTFTIRLFNITAADDASQLYGTDGTADINYICGAMPVKLVSSENTSGEFKSYYMPNDPTAIVKLEFDGEISSALASLTFGSLDVEGDYYTESLTPVINGNVVTVDLSGKMRSLSNIVASGNNYENMTISFSRVLDTTGQYVYSHQDGTIGGFSFTYETFLEVTANVVSDFTPAPGANLDGVNTLEIWITDEALLQYDGVLFAFSNEESELEQIVVANDMITKEADEFDETAAILTVPVPTCAGATKVVVSLNNLMSADGIDHSKDVYAEFLIGQSGIDAAFDDATGRYVVYNTQGILVLDTTDRNAVNNLPEGFYIINGKKLIMAR